VPEGRLLAEEAVAEAGEAGAFFATVEEEISLLEGHRPTTGYGRSLFQTTVSFCRTTLGRAFLDENATGVNLVMIDEEAILSASRRLRGALSLPNSVPKE